MIRHSYFFRKQNEGVRILNNIEYLNIINVRQQNNFVTLKLILFSIKVLAYGLTKAVYWLIKKLLIFWIIREIKWKMYNLRNNWKDFDFLDFDRSSISSKIDIGTETRFR